VRVLQNPNEIPLTQRLAVATEQLERFLADLARGDGPLAGRERRHGETHETDRFLAR